MGLDILVLNLIKDTDRKSNIINQFKKFNISNYSFIEGIDGDNLSDTYLKKIYNEKHSKRYFGRTLSKGEIGCLLSHRLIYEKILNENKNYLILEDDIILTETFKGFHSKPFIFPSQADIIYLGYRTNVRNNYMSKYFNKFLNISNTEIVTNFNNHSIFNTYYPPISLNDNNFYKFNSLNVDDIDLKIYGTFAYIPNKRACRMLLNLTKKILEPIDVSINSSVINLNLYCPKISLIHGNTQIKSTIGKR